MPAPTTSDEFLELVRKSGVLEQKRLDACLDKSRAAGSVPKEPAKMAGLLFREGLLTRFQAEQFLQGKWRRFTIGKYKVLDRIAAGGMGSVYLCEHKFMRRRAAVKVLPASRANDPSALERFYREARAVAALDHPNIVRAYDIDEDENLHFLVMEYVDGSSLQQVVKKSGPLDPVRSAHYISQAALGLQHAHEVAGLVHRDIKPGNLIVDRGGTVKILDMGLARFFHDEEDLLTQKYDENVLGTADYLAPEQALDSHGVDIRADIYSLGATFYYCLTGRTPFSDGSVAQKLIWHQTRQPKPIQSLRPDVPDQMAAVVEKMMSKDPAQRYQLPADVVQALVPWTRSAIAPPQEAEMPQTGAGGTATSDAAKASTTPVPSRPPSSQKLAGKPPSAGPAAGEQRAAVPAPKKDLPAAIAAQSMPEAHRQTTPVLSASAPAAQADPIAQLAESGFSLPKTDSATSSDEDTLCWGHLARDTKELMARADTLPNGTNRAGLRQPRVKTFHLLFTMDRSRWWVLGTSAGLVLVLIFELLVLAYREDGAPPQNTNNPAPAAARPILRVNHNGQKNAYPTIFQAVRAAWGKPNARILVEDDVIEEQLDLSEANQISIETDGGKTVIWACPEKPADAKQLVTINNAERVLLRGFTFQGRDKLDQIISLFGENPGLVLQDLKLSGFKRCGILVVNCAGGSDRPIVFQDLELATAREVEAGLLFELNAKFSHPKLNEYFAIRNCRFEGPYKKTVALTQPNVLQHVNWDGNMVRPKPGKPWTPLKPP